MNKTIEQTVKVDEASVGRLAYQLWEIAGRPSGRDLEFWLAAEAQMHAAKPAAHPEVAQQPAAASSKETSPKSSRVARGGIKRVWPKPYPSLPKF